MTLSQSQPALLLVSLLLVSRPSVEAQDAVVSTASPSFEEILSSWASEKSGSTEAADDFLLYIDEHTRLRGPTPRTREARVLRRLAKGSPGTYAPIIGLYTRAHLLAVEQENTAAADYLRLEATRLIEEYMSTVRSPQGWHLGSRFYVSLAASLRDTIDIGLALGFFLEALDAEPGNAQALIGAATIREKYGEYSGATNLLRRLLKQAPIPEAQLRLALCLARSGKLEAAERLMEDLARGPGPDWIRAIAYQEWSQQRMKRGDPDAALRLAREGHQALPHDESLAVLLAFMSGPRDPRSPDLIARLTSEPTGVDLTARGLYNLWPPGVVNNDEILSREIEVRMPLLVKALRIAAESMDS
jgi:tetratricopeptide (TPR) repeat protein